MRLAAHTYPSSAAIIGAFQSRRGIGDAEEENHRCDQPVCDCGEKGVVKVEGLWVNLNPKKREACYAVN